MPKPEKKARALKPKPAMLRMADQVARTNNDSSRLLVGTIDKYAYFEFVIKGQKLGLLLTAGEAP